MYYSRNIFYLYLLAALLAYGVIVLGAYTRLSDAGLGCPDWPGCYGRMIVPQQEAHVEQANQAYPDRPLEHAKAWKEMIHRYAAGTLGLLIMLFVIKSWMLRAKGKPSPVFASSALLLLVIFQAALGMWTVTLLLKPVVVTAHLLGGMLILALLFWLMLNALAPADRRVSGKLTRWAIVAAVVVYGQIALGGWVSANYSALICPDFPTCRGQWWPQMDFREGFILWRGLGVDYEGGVLDGAARTAVQVSHRIGAVLTFLVVSSVAVRALLTRDKYLVRTGVAVMAVLFLQLSLGIANIFLVLPLAVAVAHNGVAALLLLSLVCLLYFSFSTNAQTEN